MILLDTEIIKALELCTGDHDERMCPKCPYKYDEACYLHSVKDALNLIKRQQAEIERLTARNFELSEKGEKVCIAFKTAKIEAYKEFAKFLIDKSYKGIINICDLPCLIVEKLEEQKWH